MAGAKDIIVKVMIEEDTTEMVLMKMVLILMVFIKILVQNTIH